MVLNTLPSLIPSDTEQSSLGILEKLQYPAFLSHGDLDSLKKLYDTYNASIKKLAVEEDVHLIDLNAPFHACDEQRDRYFSDTRHPNLEGNRIIAQTLAEGLQDRGLVR